MNIIKNAAYAAAQSLSKQGLVVQRSHLSEVLAALLGYKSLAACQTEESDSSLEYHLVDAERLVLNQAMGSARALELGLPGPVCISCSDAILQSATIPVHSDLTLFFDDYAREVLEEAIINGENTANEMAGSNASFPYGPDLEPTPGSASAPVEELWSATAEWNFEANGTMEGEYDPDGDRMYNGHELSVRGTLTFAKAGRAGLILIDQDEGAGLDDGWRDEGDDAYDG